MDIFLIVLGLVWITFASISDLKKREVPNWLNFSLIAFAISYRAIYSLVNGDVWFLIYGLFGLAVFVCLGYLFYYARMFAGGDAKLLFGLGAILPNSVSVSSNIMIFGVFLFILLFCGAMYGLIYSLMIVLGDRKIFFSEFKKQFKKQKTIINLSSIAFILLAIMTLWAYSYYSEFADLVIFPLALTIIFPFLFIYAKSVEEACMIKLISVKELTEGDWLYEKVKVGRREIMPNWEGLSMEEIKLLRKNKGKVKIKQGIPFVPAFWFAFIIYLFYNQFALN